MAATAEQDTIAPSTEEQIAAIRECIETAHSVMRDAIGASPAFATIRQVYQRRVDRLEAAIAALQAAGAARP